MLTTEQAATLLGTSRQGIANYRKLGMPHQVISTRKVYYDEMLILKWIDDNFKNGRYSKFKK